MLMFNFQGATGYEFAPFVRTFASLRPFLLACVPQARSLRSSRHFAKAQFLNFLNPFMSALVIFCWPEVEWKYAYMALPPASSTTSESM